MKSKAHANACEGPSSFVGRAGDIAALLARFDEGARLVTLVAPGGMGKTRVASRFAESHGAAYAAHGGGVWFCDLTDAGDVAAMCRAVASVLGVALERTTEESAVVAALGQAIARKNRVLLVLDNMEQIATAAAGVVAAWMKVAPHARILVTSRAVLGIAGEHLVPLEPLRVPEPAASREEVFATEGVALFMSRAREVRPDFDVGPAELAALGDVVRATDGIPLAIELCAARVRLLGLAQIRSRLAESLDFLVRREDRGRHSSMRRAILDSLVQLDEAERACFAASSVFRGGFTLEAAESVLARPGADVLSVLEGLVARSLVRMRAEGAAPRFSLFEAIRELAAEELEKRPGELERAAERHTRWFARFGRALAEEAAFGGAARESLGREMDNMVAAHARALVDAERAPEGDGAALALGLALALEPIVVPRGLFELRLVLLDRAITAAQATARGRDLPELAAALVARGAARRELGDAKTAASDLEAGLALARARGDAALEARACTHLGEIVETLGRTVEARAHFTRGLGCLEGVAGGRSRRAREAEIRACLGHALRREGDLVAAEREAKRALALYRDADCEDRLPRVLYETGVIALFRESYVEAVAHFDEALAIVRRIGDKHAEGAVLSAQGILFQERGKLDEALGCHAHAVRIFHEIGSRHREGSALYYLGGAFFERGSPGEATKMLGRSFDLMGAAGFHRYEALIAGCLASVWSDEGDPEASAQWLAKAQRAAAACESEPALQATLAIHEVHVAWAKARDPERARLLDEARALARGRSNDDVRFALRLLLAAGRHGPAAPAEALVISDDGARLRLPGARAPLDLSRRAPLRRILLALAKLRASAPGQTLPLDEIIRAGWPGERIGADAAANRVRVALATLRKLGLREVLMTGQGGYLLDPATAVYVQPSGR
ncbi:tetratricopeptide repeat protein [Polyangium sp. 6x1]|uniref:tetratricopeptide repeat protein n=1 Tax=Polyangium sp. 6x1 TaxID=3042689 RepID=UPI002482702B|nr:tetratricopeptide repeat protein [Polyangium sp. 6x1]MDI1446278.1 tetratricopeptide repeat protein [Polyangium sp. 6x1]